MGFLVGSNEGFKVGEILGSLVLGPVGFVAPTCSIHTTRNTTVERFS